MDAKVFGGKSSLLDAKKKAANGTEDEDNKPEVARKTWQRYSGTPLKTEQSVSVRTERPHTSASSLIRLVREKRARRVRFYRNGDRFFKGIIYAVSTERFRNFENLMDALTSSPICDKSMVGVKSIFTLDGAKCVEDLEDLEDGESYVCASNDVFRTLDYSKNEDPDWNVSSRGSSRQGSRQSSQQRREDHKKEDRLRSKSSQSQYSPQGQPERPVSTPTVYTQSETSFVCARLITVLKQGKRPRRAVRLLLNRKTAQNYDQVMSDISEAIKLDTGVVHKLYTVAGRRVTCLADFFTDDTIFIACGKEKVTVEQLELDHNEVRQVNAYRPSSGGGGRARDRVTLRRRGENSASRGSRRADDLSTASKSMSASTITSCTDDVTSRTEGPDDRHSDISNVKKPLALTNKYDVGSRIGNGNFAVVLECKEKKTKRKYALKIISKEFGKRKEKMLGNEVRILRCLNHPNIIRLVEDYTNSHAMFYIMELVKGGDLFDAIASSTKYTEADASGMLHNLASALEYLHAMRIVHRDVKPENLLIHHHEDGTKSLKLGDFGLATEVKGQLLTVCGTPTYVAPEVISETGYAVKIDVWSAGVIAYILLCGFPPFSSPSDNQEELFELIMSGSYDFPEPYWEGISVAAKSLIKRMLEVNPEKRLSASQVLQHKWVAGEATSEADLQKRVSSGLGSFFRRSPKGTRRVHGAVTPLAFTSMAPVEPSVAKSEPKVVQKDQEAEPEKQEKPKENGALSTTHEATIVVERGRDDDGE